MTTQGYTSTLFLARLCYVYKIPPRSSLGGYRASDWADKSTGDLASTAIWKGRLRVVDSEEEPEIEGGIRKGRCEIRLEDSETGETFALCPYDVTASSVEAVLDSSRYFVLRVESEGPNGGAKRKAFIGMGFEDRSDSFDFNVALQDWTKRQKRQEAASAAGTTSSASDGQDSFVSTGPSPHLPKEGAKDLSLKEGQTFSIKLPGGAGGRKIRATDSGNSSGFGGFGGGGLLPPPPGRRG